MNGKALMVTTVASVCVAAMAALAIPSHAALRPAHAAVTTNITVTTFNSSYHLSAKTAPRGVVVFKITNKAHFIHDFSINGQTSKVLKTGESTTLRVAFDKPGHYVYKDTIDHHVQWGDVGGFYIT